MKIIGLKAAKKKKVGQKHFKKRIPVFCIAHFLEKQNKKRIALGFFGKSLRDKPFFFFFFFFAVVKKYYFFNILLSFISISHILHLKLGKKCALQFLQSVTYVNLQDVQYLHIREPWVYGVSCIGRWNLEL